MCRAMNKPFSIFHAFQAAGGIFFGVFVGYVAYANNVEGRPDLTPGRITLSILLILYSGLQFFRLYASKITLVQLLSYPVIYVMFGFFWEYSSRGYIKNWAPATASEASHQNYISLFVLILIAIIGVWATLRNRSGASDT